MTEETTKKEPKRKFVLWVKESTLEQVRNWYPQDNCSSQSEFIEKAIWFYIGYISSNNESDYLPKILISTLKGILNESDNRISRILFKLAVEQAIAMNVIAATNGITKEQLHSLRGTCVQEVKKTMGSILLMTLLTSRKGNTALTADKIPTIPRWLPNTVRRQLLLLSAGN